MKRKPEAWIQTLLGHAVDLQCPRKSQIYLVDIASHLSKICRFTGATLGFCSVAAHSVLVADILRETYPGSYRLLTLGLLHDAHEAYLSDVSSPLKALIGPWYECLANRMQRTIMRALDIKLPSAVEQAAIGLADLQALALEKKAEIGVGERPWRPLPDTAHLRTRVQRWRSFDHDKRRFLETYDAIRRRT